MQLLGQRFGRLVVVSEAPILNGGSRWECRCDCGETLITEGYSLRHGATTSCGCFRRETTKRLKSGHGGASNPNWKGGRKIDKDGYVRVFVSKRRYVLEHRQVMEQMLGRKLKPTETVHHKNGVRTDNTPDNLELWATRHGKGQRVSDQDEYDEDYLRGL